MSAVLTHSLLTASNTSCHKQAFKPLSTFVTPQQQLRTSQKPLLRPSTAACKRTGTRPRAAGVTKDTAVSAELWQAFSQNIAGEWEGVTATFGADGSPQALPAEAVPKEFSNWDITLYDYQSQCSMLPQASGVKCLLKRILPTVGCEADAQTFHEDSSTLFEGAAESQHAILHDGSYSITSSMALAEDTKGLRCEHSLMLGKKKRVRLVQHLKSVDATSPWQLSAVELHNERYDQPYNGGAQLSGCGGGMNNIAEEKKLDVAQLQHEWSVQSGSSFEVSSSGLLPGSEASQRYGKDGYFPFFLAGLLSRLPNS